LTISKFLDENVLNLVEVSMAEVQRAYIRKGLATENISLEEAAPFLEQEILVEKQGDALLAYIEQLRANATITILLEEAREGITSFSQTGDIVCIIDGRVPVYMFTSSACKECRTVAARLIALLQSYEKNGVSPFASYIWELDTGDNLYTKAVENGIPKEHVAVFKGVTSEGKIPAYSFGCMYTRVGHLPGAGGNLNAEEREFDAVLATLVVHT
jgi:hypothetical protein